MFQQQGSLLHCQPCQIISFYFPHNAVYFKILTYYFQIILMFFINHVLKFKYQPRWIKVTLSHFHQNPFSRVFRVHERPFKVPVTRIHCLPFASVTAHKDIRLETEGIKSETSIQVLHKIWKLKDCKKIAFFLDTTPVFHSNMLPAPTNIRVTCSITSHQWRTQEFFFWGGGVQQIQLRTERTGIWEAVAP